MKPAALFSALAFTLATTVSAATADTTAIENHLFKRSDLCGTSSFHDETSSGSASVSDCNKIVRDMENEAGNFLIGPVRDELYSAGNCRFMVYAKRGAMGSDDVADLIRDSISKFAKNGKVGARGSVTCKGVAEWSDQSKVDWWIWKK